MSDLEPFADRALSIEGGINSPQYRVGFRLLVTQAIVAQLEIPAEVIEQAVLAKLFVAPRLTPDGKVTADISGPHDLNSHFEIAAIPIDELVIAAMTPENLRLEDVTSSDLNKLLGLLEQSIMKVRVALIGAAKIVKPLE
jgi:hypothetical protein